MHNIFVVSFDMSSNSLMSLPADIFFSASEKKCILFMCMIICNNVLLEDDKLSVLYNNYIVPHCKSAAFTPSPSCSLRYVSSVPIFDFFPTRHALYILCISIYWYEYVIVTCTSTSFEIVMMGPSLVLCRPDPVDPRGRLKKQ